MRISDWSSDVCSSDLQQADRRPSYLAAADLRRRVDIGEQGRRHHGALPRAADEPPGAFGHRLGDPGLDSDGFPLADDGAGHGRWVVGVAELQRLHLPGQLRFDRRHDLLLNQQDLDRGADLAGLAVAGIDHLRQRAVQVGIVAKTGEGDGAQFHLGPPQACRLLYLAPALGPAEEHTSELQSLMRISYAVFCLKKKNNKVSINIYTLFTDTITTNI